MTEIRILVNLSEYISMQFISSADLHKKKFGTSLHSAGVQI